ncbi:unnamed protein product [Fraxinus pennsylvanica]|uniref:BZIP domain-containing protein n=1 Tax=Fraxinus pennsylvanica TaxID=56036 RepID=A0AAD1Z6H2_9LAMI|nr:unnamed protein product [Fraxinus pennsylvanica]
MNTMHYDDDDQIVMCEFEAAEALASLASNSTVRGGVLGSGRQSQRGKSEAEKEAQRRHRILANRESARKTIRQRQATYADLLRKAAKLSLENENLKKVGGTTFPSSNTFKSVFRPRNSLRKIDLLYEVYSYRKYLILLIFHYLLILVYFVTNSGKKEKERAVKDYDYLKNKNECLKSKMAKIAEIEEESKKFVQVPTTTPIFPYNHPSIVPFLWPAIGIQGSSHFPIPSRDNILCSFQDQEHAKRINKQGTSLFVMPLPFHTSSTTLHSPICPNGCCNHSSTETETNSDQNYQLRSSQKTKSESSKSAEIMPIDQLTPKRKSRTKSITDDTTGVDAVPSASRSTAQDVSSKNRKLVIFSSKRSGNANTAAEARKRRKELMKLKVIYPSSERGNPKNGLYETKIKAIKRA